METAPIRRQAANILSIVCLIMLKQVYRVFEPLAAEPHDLLTQIHLIERFAELPLPVLKAAVQSYDKYSRQEKELSLAVRLYQVAECCQYQSFQKKLQIPYSTVLREAGIKLPADLPRSGLFGYVPTMGLGT